MINFFTHGPREPLHNFWNNIHFHPTDAIEDRWGQEILDEIARDGVAETVRMYAMLEDIVTMDEKGLLHYDFTENDTRLDYLLSRGFKIFLSYNYMPPCITEDPLLLAHANKKSTRYKGKLITTARLSDDALWEEICYRYTEHIVERYGLDNVKNWYLQCYNEPDHVNYFMKELGKLPENFESRLEEYMRIYRGFSRAIARVSPSLYVGGPALASNLSFLDAFLSAVEKEELKLDFLSVHTYGTGPELLNSGERPFMVESNLNRILEYKEILDKHFPTMEIVVDEWGAAWSGFYDREECPKLLFREGSEYAAYYLKSIVAYLDADLHISRQMICLSGQHDLPCDFSGCRNFMGINKIKKPIYNAYLLGSKLGETRLVSECDVDNVTTLATQRADGAYFIAIAYASEHFDRILPSITDTLSVDGIQGTYRIRIYCIDEKCTNPYKYALQKGWGDHFNEAQIKELRRVGTLTPLNEYEAEATGILNIPLSFTCNALVGVELTPVR